MERFRIVIPNFLSKEKCDELIAFSENEGYEEALVKTRGLGEVMNKNMRDNDKVIWHSPETAIELWESVKDVIPTNIEGYEPTGLDETFRFYRYQDGQQFKPHIDGPTVKSETEKSKITLLIYLNEGFEGGSTTLILENENIVPKTGNALLFEHKIMHSGRPVINGIKYVLRTDIMYKLITE